MVEREKSKKKIPSEEDPAMRLVGFGKSGKKDLSVRHDKYLAKHATIKKK